MMEHSHAATEHGHAAIATAEGGEHKHAAPGTMAYVAVAALLTVLTVMEIGVFYVPALRIVLVPVLVVLSGAKFALVVMFYMHLRYDHVGYTIIFVPLLFLAVLVVCTLFALFTAFLGA